MAALKMVAILLIVIGTIGLAYGGFSYTKDVHQADVGPVHMSLTEKGHITIPIWAGIACICAGGVLLLIGKKS